MFAIVSNAWMNLRKKIACFVEMLFQIECNLTQNFLDTVIANKVLYKSQRRLHNWIIKQKTFPLPKQSNKGSAKVGEKWLKKTPWVGNLLDSVGVGSWFAQF